MTLVADKSPTSNESNDIKDAVIRLAGNSQDGIQTVGGLPVWPVEALKM